MHCHSIVSCLHCLSPAGLMLWVIFYLSLEKTGHIKASPNSTTKYTSMSNYFLENITSNTHHCLWQVFCSFFLFYKFLHFHTHDSHHSKQKQIQRIRCWWFHSDVTSVDRLICFARCLFSHVLCCAFQTEFSCSVNWTKIEFYLCAKLLLHKSEETTVHVCCWRDSGA